MVSGQHCYWQVERVAVHIGFGSGPSGRSLMSKHAVKINCTLGLAGWSQIEQASVHDAHPAGHCSPGTPIPV